MATRTDALLASDDARAKLDIIRSYLASVAAPVVTPDSFGAAGDGTTDDTTALQAALNATTSGEILTIPLGKTYRHTAVLQMNNAGATLQGGGTILATAEATSAFQVRAANVTVQGDTSHRLVFKMSATTVRGSGLNNHKLCVTNGAGTVTGTTLRWVEVDGASGAGVFTSGGINYTYDDLYVHDTRADAIHSTYGSTGGVINRPIVKNPGDDGVAVVSYIGDGASNICTNITINDAVVAGQGGAGRGCSVVGGNNIVYNNTYCSGTNAAGVYVAAESSFNTHGVNGVTFNGATLDGCNYNSATDHGAVNLFNGQSGKSVINCTFNDFTIRCTRHTASDQVRMFHFGNPAFANIAFTRFTIIQGTSNLFGTDAASSEYTRTDWTFNGAPVPGTSAPALVETLARALYFSNGAPFKAPYQRVASGFPYPMGGIATGTVAIDWPLMFSLAPGGFVRQDYMWRIVQPSNATTWDWSVYDARVADINANGGKVLAMLGYTPAWANGGSSDDKFPPAAGFEDEWQEFCRRFAERYIPEGVRVFELWNEPNISRFWKPAPSVSQYLSRVLIPGAAGLRAAAAAAGVSITILTAGTAPAGGANQPDDWYAALYAAGAKNHFDAVANHPYTWPYPPNSDEAAAPSASWSAMQQTRAIYDTMVSYGDGGKLIWATEVGLPSRDTGPFYPTDTASQFVSHQTMATRINEIFAEWLTLPLSGQANYVGPIIWYQHKNAGAEPVTNVENGFGVVYSNGTDKPGSPTPRANLQANFNVIPSHEGVFAEVSSGYSWYGGAVYPSTFLSAERVNAWWEVIQVAGSAPVFDAANGVQVTSFLSHAWNGSAWSQLGINNITEDGQYLDMRTTTPAVISTFSGLSSLRTATTAEGTGNVVRYDQLAAANVGVMRGWVATPNRWVLPAGTQAVHTSCWMRLVGPNAAFNSNKFLAACTSDRFTSGGAAVNDVIQTPRHAFLTSTWQNFGATGLTELVAQPQRSSAAGNAAWLAAHPTWPKNTLS